MPHTVTAFSRRLSEERLTMRNADIRRLDREILATTKKLEAVRRGE